MAKSDPTPLFFATPKDFRVWLRSNHRSATAQWVGFYRKDSGRPSITWPESVDEALCVGWIDGVRKSIDRASYMIRFTPRKKASTWSAVNIARIAELTRQKRMCPAGLRAFEMRTEAKSGVYAYEQSETAMFDAAAEKAFRADVGAWDFFQTQPAGYRRTAIWWVISAKRSETRAKRLATLMQDSKAAVRLKKLQRD